MDGSQFDAWTRTMVAETSRRAALKTLTGGLVTGALGAIAIRDASAASCGAKGDRCESSRDCCNGLKCNNNGKCEYNQNCGGKKGDYCKKNKDCCDGFRCKGDACKRCKTRNEQCNNDRDCCPGFNCRQGLCKS